MPAGLVSLFLILCTLWTGYPMTGGSLLRAEESPTADGGRSSAEPAPVMMKELPAVIAEGSNKCEIVSCGMGIKETCQITCPADKTPKCSCDCARDIGPICMEYKANCRCE